MRHVFLPSAGRLCTSGSEIFVRRSLLCNPCMGSEQGAR